jgi:hypothetical protein
VAKKRPEDLTFERLPNGDTLFHGLRPQMFNVPGHMIGELMKLSREGGLWPYVAVKRSYDKDKDVHLVEIKES